MLTISLGFTDDIGAEPDDLNLAVSLFYLTFVLLQPFSAAMGNWLGPNRWIPFIMVTFAFPSPPPSLGPGHTEG